MPESSAGRQINGDDLIAELLRNVEAGIFKARYTALVPCIFNVYLHPSDYDQIHPIVEFVRSEARAALNDELAKLNKTSGSTIARWFGVGSGQQIEFKKLEPDWVIDFHPDAEERLRPGDIEVFSELGTGQRTEFGSGAMTTFITRKPAEPHAEAPAGPAAETATAGTARTDRQVHGYLRYEDTGGSKTFPITRDQTVIGRGGKAFWVDLKLEGPPDVSREHCRIRRDPATGEFFIKDLSQYGTTIDGKEIPSSLERSPQGEKVDRNIETPLPPRARIGLAGVFFIEFEAGQMP